MVYNVQVLENVLVTENKKQIVIQLINIQQLRDFLCENNDHDCWTGLILNYS